ncbi:MAG: hypothetical protein H6810_02710 [Phycisphaeraceae bacterium]|nr:MAG: hypothetical protein H6810_02710 [Phycisphaeraceae bacterium]
MRDVARLIAIGVALLACAAFRAAATPQPGTAPASPAASADLPPAEEIFERYIEAIGGREKIDQIHNRRIEGTFAGEPFEFRASLKIWWEEDGRYHQFVSEPAGLRFNIMRNGDYTWVQVQDKDPSFLGGMQRVELIDTADFTGEVNYKNRYREYRTVGKAKADEQPVWVVQAITHIGRPHMLYFNRDTGLLVGTRVPTTGKDNKPHEMMVRVGNYQEFGGVLYPTLVQQQFVGTDRTSEYRYTSIEVNVDDGHDYTVPDSIKAAYEEALANSPAAKGDD